MISELMTRSLSRNSNDGRKKGRSLLSGTKSLGRSSGISFLKNAEHTEETQDTHFIRAATGRGSIKRGPAPTRASVLRQAKTSDAGVKWKQSSERDTHTVEYVLFAKLYFIFGFHFGNL